MKTKAKTPSATATSFTWWSKSEIEQGLQDKSIVLGEFHSTRRDLGFVRLSDDLKRDVFVNSVDHVNRAMDGDFVACKLLQATTTPTTNVPPPTTLFYQPVNLPEESSDALWAPTELSNATTTTTSDDAEESTTQQQQQHGKIVALLDRSTLEPLTRRILSKKELTGTIQVPASLPLGERFPANVGFTFFQCDSKAHPSLIINRQDLPVEFIASPHQEQTTIYRAQLTSWPEGKGFPNGVITGKLGTRGEIHSESLAILLNNNVNTEPFPPEALACLPTRFDIEEHLENRRDLRGELIFTIDPETARDIDDALHCTPLGEDRFEVGVHIADVSYFVQPGTALDLDASQRATSVYLVQKCLPMLPPQLSEEWCSLNPHVDRLAFSCIFVLRSNGELDVKTQPWFGRSVIRSRCKLDYQLAQRIADGAEDWQCTDASRLPVECSKDQVQRALQDMVKVGMNRRKLRFTRGGALNLQQNKVWFQLNELGNPVSLGKYPIGQTNQLVEEFMLLANFLVAQRLLQGPSTTKSFLRNHPPPDLTSMDKVFALLKIKAESVLGEHGVSAQQLQAYLSSLPKTSTTLLVVRELLKVPMKLAKYVVRSETNALELRHWALNIRYYTHFTSPIRRYADLIVHRQLAHALANKMDPTSIKWLSKQAEVCNTKKEEAKQAGDESLELYLNLYVASCGEKPPVCTAVVVDVGEASFQVLLPEFGLSKRVHVVNELKWAVSRVVKEKEQVVRLHVVNALKENFVVEFMVEFNVALLPLKGKLGFKLVKENEVHLHG